MLGKAQAGHVGSRTMRLPEDVGAETRKDEGTEDERRKDEDAQGIPWKSGA